MSNTDSKEQHASSLREELRIFIDSNKNQYNISDISDIIDKDFNLSSSRTTNPLYFSKTVYEEWKRFCKVNPKYSTAALTEKAFIYAMLHIPNENALVQIEIPDKEVAQQTLDDRLREIILLPDLETWLNAANRRVAEGEGIPNPMVEKVHTLFRDADRIKNKSEKLRILLEEAMDRVE